MKNRYSIDSANDIIGKELRKFEVKQTNTKTKTPHKFISE